MSSPNLRDTSHVTRELFFPRVKNSQLICLVNLRLEMISFVRRKTEIIVFDTLLVKNK